MQLKDLKRGDFFKRKATSSIVYIRDEYERTLKKYSCYKFDDVNSEIFLKGSTEVYTDFTF